jgi:hypothetical protein
MTQPVSANQAVIAGGSGAANQRLFGPWSFRVVFAVLLIAAMGLVFVTERLKIHFRKESVPMRMAFKAGIPEQLGDWVRIGGDEKLDEDLLKALATDQYLFCDYLDHRALGRTPEGLRQEFAALTPKDQKALLGRLQQQQPTAALRVALTYYTGKADTVAHIPERCYIGDGWDIETPPENQDWDLDRDLQVRFITFENQGNRSAAPSQVAYFFHINGKYSSSSDFVRMQLQDLFNRYGYYAKVELMCTASDRNAAADAMKRFLASALPAVEKVLPDWSLYSPR